MNRSYEGFRILLVHAHPDDETINNGATMALYADRGAQVTLVTCTRGEEGEVLVPTLSHLSSSEQDLLGTHREVELAEAMKALGISDHRFLGAPTTKFRDSGMMGTEPNNRPDVFWQADLDAAAKILVEVIEETKPHVLDGVEYVDAKMAAMKAHETQISLDGPFFALSNNLGLQIWGDEYYTLVKGTKSGPFDAKGRETDLTSGITL